MAGDNCGSGDEPDSSCLVLEMFFGFMEEDPQGIGTSNCCNGAQTDDPEMISDVTHGSEPRDVLVSKEQYRLLENYTYCTSSIAERILKNETVKALEMARENTTLCVCEHDDEDFKCKVTSCLQRTVMNHLRHAGYNAAICNSQFKYMAGGFPHKGNYEYMDVILKITNSGRSIRLFIDLDFRAQFEIARPSEEYSALLGLVPKIYVGRGDRLQSIVKIMCEGVKNSLKRKGMHLPPWRKYKYMHFMWFAPYNRTIPSVLNGHEETKNREKRHEYKTAIKSKEKQRSRSQLPCDSVFDGKMVEWKSGSGDNNSAVRRNETVEWKLPVVANPAMEKRQPKVSGLASALKETLSSGFCLAAF
uniref:DUF506 family protein n=1 Tax=Picea sitchensis TaxID=3332 RepID=A9NW18_PICSI|nr:unknown [Picea sitchensis]